MNIVFDIGGTKMRVGGTLSGRSLTGEPVVAATPEDFSKGVEKFILLARQIAGGKKIKRIVGGIAGVLDKNRTGLTRSLNLGAWVNQPFKRELERAFDAPVFLYNDTALVGLGEAARGAGRGFKIAAYLTISTGVGGVRVVNKQIDLASYGFEPGHQLINYKAGESETLEQMVSGRSIEKLLDKKPYEVEDGRVWEALAEKLAVGIHNTIVYWSPDVVVLGGSMVVRPIGIKLERIRDYLRRISKVYPELPVLRLAELGDFGGLHGGLEIIANQSSQD